MKLCAEHGELDLNDSRHQIYISFFITAFAILSGIPELLNGFIMKVPALIFNLSVASTVPPRAGGLNEV